MWWSLSNKGHGIRLRECDTLISIISHSSLIKVDEV